MKLFFTLVLLCLCFATPAMGGDLLTFTTADNQNHRRAKAMNTLMRECFSRLDIAIAIQPLPSKRSLYDANHGEADGNFVRTKGISEAYPNLIQVPEPISVNVIVAYSRSKSIKVDGWKSLLPYHVCWVRGWRNCERELSKARSVSEVNSEKIMFGFLSQGRAEVGIFGLETGLEMLEKEGITNVHPLFPPIVESDLFLYMNKKHKAMIPEVARTLREMKEDGTYQAILDRFSN